MAIHCHSTTILLHQTGCLLIDLPSQILGPTCTLCHHFCSHYRFSFTALHQTSPSVDKTETISRQSITDMGINYLGQYCPRLISLYLTRAQFLTEAAILTIGQRYRNLCSLNLTDCQGISPHCSVFSALRSCPLQKLFLEVGSLKLSPGKMQVDLDFDLFALPHLQKLLLVACPDDFSHHLFTMGTADGSKMVLSACWPNLQVFHLEGCRDVTDASLVTFIQTHPRLVSLALVFDRFSDQVLDAISLHLPLIEIVNLSYNRHITAQGIRRLARRCNQLRRVMIEQCRIRVSAFLEADSSCFDIENYTNSLNNHNNSDDDGDNISIHSDEPPHVYLLDLDYAAITEIQDGPDPEQQQQQQQ